MKSMCLFSGKSDQEASILAIQENAVAVLQQFAPGGEVQGNEYVSLNPSRADSNLGSFKFNLESQA